MTDTVRIGDREFRVGATYAPKRGNPSLVRRLHSFDPGHDRERSGMNRPGGAVLYINSGRFPCRCSAQGWLRWAGEEVVRG